MIGGRRWLLIGFLAAFAALAPVRAVRAGGGDAAAAAGVTIRYLGHCSFFVSASAGASIVTDPFYERIGYPLPELTADVLTISSADNTANNNEFFCRNDPLILRAPGRFETAIGVVSGTRTFRDNKDGKVRGENVVFCFTLANVRFCHLGLLGHRLGAATAREIGPVDVLFLPVGGKEAIDLDTARDTVKQLAPRVVIPMFFHTAQLRDIVGLRPVEDFLRGQRHVRRVDGSSVTLAAAEVRALDGEVVVLAPPAAAP
ncbi:MAG: MBL fold metallo-hydrolase [Candidatus Schekmanbacteria bacterium]|nr:MBL fold metallo-hydrolase [Candidatus Schekmanbacteria bacterium]